MANNDSGNGHDPWKRDGDAPIELDQIVKDWQKRFGRILGGGGGKDARGSGIALFILLLLAWGLTGLYQVDAAERGVVQRFGKHVHPSAQQDTTAPGLRWHMPFPIETVDIVNIHQVNDYNFSTEILTADEQYVFIDIVVQYRRTDPVQFSFKVAGPEETLQDVTESALRGVVGTSTLTELIGERRAQIPERTIVELQGTLEGYGAGLTVTSINLNVIDYPKSVREAVDDTQKARNDKDRVILAANTYRNDIIPRARGQAQRVLQEAEAYRDRLIADAEGESARFESLLVEYQKAPKVTRDRLYIEAVEDIYGRSNKVFLDSQGSGNLLYLPVDQLLKRSNSAADGESSSPFSESARTRADSSSDSRLDSSRERRIRE